MDLTVNRYDALILRLANISPLARHIMDREQYRLRLETDDVDSEAVLQECVLALRDDLAEIGLYLNCPLGDLYGNLSHLAECLDVFDLIFPKGAYAFMKRKIEFYKAVEDLLTGGVGDTPTIQLYLELLQDTLDRDSDDPTNAIPWLLGNLTNTPLFDTYLQKVLTVDTTLGQFIPLTPEDLAAYTKKVRTHADILYQVLDQLSVVPEVAIDQENLRKRIDLYIRSLLQPGHIASLAWLRMTDPATLSPHLQQIFHQRWREFAVGSRLYGAYYLRRTPVTFTSFALCGIAIRCYADDPDRIRSAYLKALTQEIDADLTLTIPLRGLMMRLVDVLYSTSDET